MLTQSRTMKRSLWWAVLALVLSCARATSVMAQNDDCTELGIGEVRADSVARSNLESPAGEPALRIHASVSAREVRFAKQPQLRVRLCGGTLDSVRVIERRNLPSPVRVGTTYRDVFIAVEILGHLNASCLGAAIQGQRGESAECGIRLTAPGDSTRPSRTP
jgi:hypothetical protein